MKGLLDKEIQTYEKRKKELLAQATGKFALIKDGRVWDIFENKMDAIRHGYERFGDVPFLVKQIQLFDTPQSFTSNLIGK